MKPAPPKATGVGAPALSASVQYLRGCGPHLASVLRTLGILTIQDLLFHLPRAFEDRRAALGIGRLQSGEDALVLAQVDRAEVRFGPRRALTVWAHDAEGHTLRLRFFHFNEQQRQAFGAGRWVRAFGTARGGLGGFEMVHPEYKLADSPGDLPLESRLLPVYPLTSGITQGKLRTLIEAALELASQDRAIAMALPGLSGPATLAALRALHLPAQDADARALNEGCSSPQLRLVQEELLAHQLCMRLLRRQVQTALAPVITALPAAQALLLQQLPFALTNAQQRVLGEIAQDLGQARAMLRLVQGDVGAGKTVVAAIAMLAAVRAGLQAALMAPTELLAEQHAQTLARWFTPLGIDVVFLSGKLKKSKRNEALQRIAGEGVTGMAPVVVGTHALFQGEVRFARLGLVVVDEQHRFGVAQRLALRDKGAAGQAPHQLIMSATPIPRTLAQTLYADLDVSVIDQLPPGRTPVHTVVLSNERRDEVMQRLGTAVAEGRQAYWVCTLIEESDELEAQAAETTAMQLRAALPGVAVGLVHGRMKAADKEAQMAAFKAASTHILVATTVIEVGVDVPNASLMVIENAERLGLSQLHQLRGRVGRGAIASQCLLLYQPPLGMMGKARLATLRETTDGFAIAQKDLELRGPGELLGARQTGLVGLKIADPQRDAPHIPALQALADVWLADHPEIARALIRRWVGDLDRYGQV